MSGRIKISWRKLKDETEGAEALGKKKDMYLCASLRTTTQRRINLWG
jgi:hypothetical protein